MEPRSITERRKFTREFKVGAVPLIKCGVTYVQASRDLSVQQTELRDWVKRFADGPQHSFPGDTGLKPANGDRAIEARSEEAQHEQDILKKAAAFAKEST